MGNSNVSSDDVDTYVHPRLGSIKRLQEANKNQFIGYELVIENQKVYEDWVKELRYIKKDEAADQILFLPIEYCFKQTTYCGTGGMASLRYEDYLYSLGLQIKNRREIKRPFNQQELLYLFYNLVKIEAILEGMNRIIGDVRPENIMVNEEGYAKIISQFSWPGQANNINSWEKDNQRLFLSPEECEERHKSKDSIRSNLHRNQSEVFSIGVTVLEAGTLRDCSYIYGHPKEYRFSEVRVRQYLDIFESRYSKQFSSFVKQMLHPNPRKRWKADRIYQLLKPFQFQILNLEQIVLKFQSVEYIPRIEREEKISIKKMGEHHTRGDQTNKMKSSEGGSNYRMSLHRSSQRGSQLQDPSGRGHAYQPSQQMSFPPHPQQQPNYHLIRQNTNFIPPAGRNQPMPRPSVEIRQNMTSSLPINLIHSDQQLTRSGPQYISQNSMMSAVGRPSIQQNYLRDLRPTAIQKSFVQQ